MKNNQQHNSCSKIQKFQILASQLTLDKYYFIYKLNIFQLEYYFSNYFMNLTQYQNFNQIIHVIHLLNILICVRLSQYLAEVINEITPSVI